MSLKSIFKLSGISVFFVTFLSVFSFNQIDAATYLRETQEGNTILKEYSSVIGEKTDFPKTIQKGQDSYVLENVDYIKEDNLSKVKNLVKEEITVSPGVKKWEEELPLEEEAYQGVLKLTMVEVVPIEEEYVEERIDKITREYLGLSSGDLEGIPKNILVEGKTYILLNNMRERDGELSYNEVLGTYDYKASYSCVIGEVKRRIIGYREQAFYQGELEKIASQEQLVRATYLLDETNKEELEKSLDFFKPAALTLGGAGVASSFWFIPFFKKMKKKGVSK